MDNIINKDVAKAIFSKFNDLSKFWFHGDLNTFYATSIIVDDVKPENILDYVGFKYDTFDLEFGLVVTPLSLFKKYNLPMDEYTLCTREEYLKNEEKSCS